MKTFLYCEVTSNWLLPTFLLLLCFLRSLRRGPPLADFFPARVEHECAGRYVVTNRGGSGDVDIVMNGQRCDQGCVRTDLHAITDLGAMLAKAVVVTGDRTRADIGVAPDLGVADIGQMLGLGVFTDERFFHLNEVSDLRPCR